MIFARHLLLVCVPLLVGADTHSSTENSQTPGIVYVVYCVDTEPDGYNYERFSQSLNMNSFIPGNIIDQTFDGTWRDSLKDSFGGHIKFTWFLMTMEGFRYTPQGINAVPDKFLKGFSEKVLEFGDEVGWHYHHADWFWDTQKKQYAWNQIRTFSDSVYREKTDRQLAFAQLASFIYLNRTYPVSFRAGWNWENTDFSNWLDSLIPFDFSNNWNEVNENIIIYRSNRKDIFKSGDLSRHIVRTIEKPDTLFMASLFERAMKGEDVILSHYTHNYGSTNPMNNTLKAKARAVHNLLVQLSDRYAVEFRYCSASEAANLLLRNNCPDTFSVNVSFDRDKKIVTATSIEHLFGVPVVCFQRKDGSIDGRFMNWNKRLNKWEYRLGLADATSFIIASLNRCGQTFLSEEMSFSR
jgi:hypothetical protein